MEEYTGLELIERMRKAVWLPTGSIQLDKILGGGLRCGIITEVHGDVGSGKSEMCIEMLINTVFLGDYHAVYVKANKLISPDRIMRRIKHVVKSMKEHSDEQNDVVMIDPEEVQRRIHLACATDLEELIHLITEADDLIKKEGKVRLIIIENMGELFPIRQSFLDIQIMYQFLINLSLIARKNVAIFLTSEIRKYKVHMSDKSKFMVCPTLGEHFQSMAHQNLYLEQSGDTLNVSVMKCFAGSVGTVKLRIDEDCGIMDNDD